MINWNPLMVFARPTYFPKELVNMLSTKKGCDKKHSILLVLAMIKWSSSETIG